MEREELKQRATELGIEFPSNVKNDKLKRLIEDKQNKGATQMNDNKEMVEKPEKVTMTLTTEEYVEYSKANGTIMGRRPDQKTKCTQEEFLVLKKSGWTPEMIMEKHGMTEEEHQQLVWAVSKAQRRDKPIAFTKNGYKE